MILYRKTVSLALKRRVVPEGPFWAATIVSPYSSRRASPTAIDYFDLRLTASDRLEVDVCADVRDELERLRPPLRQPVLIEATEFAEVVFRGGERIVEFCRDNELTAVYLTSTAGVISPAPVETTIIAAWPLDQRRLEERFREARSAGGLWGLGVPVIFPVTTHLAALEALADAAARAGAAFLGAIPVEMEATAKHAVAESLALSDDDEIWPTLFHTDLEPLHTATERHIAALAHERGLADFLLPPRWEEKSNWNAAVLLRLTASRMIAMEDDVELAGAIARSAQTIAGLEKPVAQIAAAASVAIIESLDEASIDMLTEWLEQGTARFADRINEKWRLRRDYGTDE